jgi:SAM-dependent methyltransferase
VGAGQGDHWGGHAAQWADIGPPLRPQAHDIRLLETLTAQWAPAGPNAAVLLGMTAEIAAMRWPPGTSLFAVDRNLAMIRQLWAGSARAAPALAMNGDWRSLPFADAAMSFVLGDGCHAMMPAADDYDRLSAEVSRVLAPGGVFLARLFVRPPRNESLDEVFAALDRREIGNFHVFKWRLAMAVPCDDFGAVGVDDVWRAWRDRGVDRDALAAKLGWPRRVIDTIDVYRGAPARYSFPTLARARAQLAPYFEEQACFAAPYELGERCPTLVLKPRAPRSGGRRRGGVGPVAHA